MKTTTNQRRGTGRTVNRAHTALFSESYEARIARILMTPDEKLSLLDSMTKKMYLRTQEIVIKTALV